MPRNKISDKNNLNLPPQDIEAEQSVLGALLLDRNAINRIADILAPEDFYKPNHQIIYEAIFVLYEKQEPIDILSVSAKLKEIEKLEDIGGRAYLTTLVNSVPTASHVAHYAEIVHKKSVLRGLIDKSYEISDLAKQEDKEIDWLLDEAEQKIFSISKNSLKQDFTPIEQVLGNVFERTEKIHREGGGLRGVATGFQNLDKILSGLQQSDLIVLAARPSLGKTSLALDVARHVALREKKAVGIFSLEMPKEQVTERMLASEAMISLHGMRTGKLSMEGEDSDFERLAAAMDKLNDAPIFIDDSATQNIVQMRAMARRLQARNELGLGLIVVDYLQLMTPRTKSDSMVQQITEISRSLKGLARELSTPVLALSQLSRAVEQRPNQVPKLSDLRESGSIEQDADVVMMIYRPDRVKESAEKNIAELIIAKHRNGPIGKVPLYFNESSVSFTDIERNLEE